MDSQTHDTSMYKTILNPILVVTFLLFLTPSSFAEKLRVYIEAIHHRPAIDLVEKIRPFLNKTAVLTSNGYNLIIKADYKNYLIAKILIRQFDQPLKKLKISVSQDNRFLSQSNSSFHTNIKIINSESKRRRDKIKTIVTLEGKAAFIQTSQSFPIVSQQNTNQQVSHSVKYKKLNSGFYVLAKLHGNSVSLSIATQRQALSRSGGGQFHSQTQSTQLSGPIGKWILLGGHSLHNTTSSSAKNRQIITTQKSNEKSASIYIRVDIIP